MELDAMGTALMLHVAEPMANQQAGEWTNKRNNQSNEWPGRQAGRATSYAPAQSGRLLHPVERHHAAAAACNNGEETPPIAPTILRVLDAQ